jgi:hypothetical protein
MLHHHRRYEGGDELLLVRTFRFESAAGGGGAQISQNELRTFVNGNPLYFTQGANPSSHNNKVHPTTGQQDPEVEKRYSSTLSLTSALDEVGGQRHAPAALPPGK